jgi:hypothetical protein
LRSFCSRAKIKLRASDKKKLRLMDGAKTNCNTPSILGEPVRMLQIYDPCNLMSNPSSIKFLSTRRGNRHINKKNAQRNI